MPKPKAAKTMRSEASGDDPAITDYIAKLKHPMASELLKLRAAIRSCGKNIREEIKWNAPSFYISDHFATTNIHGKDKLRLILHTGAKSKMSTKGRMKIDDPKNILTWLGKDRALVNFENAADTKAKIPALKAIIRQWIKYLD